MKTGDTRTTDFDVIRQKVLRGINNRSIVNLVALIIDFSFVCVVLPLLSGLLAAYVEYDKAWLFVLAATPIEFFVVWIVSLFYYLFGSYCTLSKCYITTHILAAVQLFRTFVFFVIGLFYLTLVTAGDPLGSRRATANKTFVVEDANRDHLRVVMVSYCWLLSFIYFVALIHIESTAKKLIYLHAARFRIAALDTMQEIETATRRLNWKLDSYMYMFYSFDTLAIIFCGGYICLAFIEIFVIIFNIIVGYKLSLGIYMIMLTAVLLAASLPFTVSDFINLKAGIFMLITALLLVALLIQFTIEGVVPFTEKFLYYSNYVVAQNKNMSSWIDSGLESDTLPFYEMRSSLAKHGVFFNISWMTLICMVHSLYVLFMAARLTKKTVAGLYIENSREDSCDRDSVDFEDNVKTGI